MPGTTRQSHFETVQQFDSEYSTHKFTEYVSKRTGMHMVVIDQEGPKVYGYFTLATEIHDDSGSPHTLEHLCFMGSKKYPYKGLLDKVATRGYSTTNAWTANDHTAYTLETAGGKAFLTILPVYLDHVVRPTLTDAGCYTEVYHIDGEGNDAGVVYSEMQGVQNTSMAIMDLDVNRILYPEGNGFRYETGGLMPALRVLTADRIREFHREMYQPKNLCLVLCGSLDHQELLRILDEFEDTILEDVPKVTDPFKRPWVESKQTEPLKESKIHTSIFPEEDESQGEIWISYLGPSCNDTLQSTALQILMTYLAGSSVSVLENALVEKEQLASSVSYYTNDRPDTVIQFMLTGVDAKKLTPVADRFKELLKETASNELNMTYMRDVIARERRAIKHGAENDDQFFQQGVIQWFLFDKRGKESTLKDIGSMWDYDALDKWTDKDWRDFLRKWLVDGHSVTCLGQPSAEMSKRLKEEEEKRVADRKSKLGNEGLKKLEQQLEAAKAENGREVPQHLLKEHAVDDPGLHFIETISAKAGLAKQGKIEKNKIQEIVDKDSADLPLYVHFEHIPSNFVQAAILISTNGIPVQLRPLLTIYTELFFNSPILRDGKQIKFEDVVMEVEKDTVDYEIGMASNLGTNEMIAVSIRVEREKYDVAIQWIRALMFDIVFEAERIESAVSKYLADVPEEKRSGDRMSSTLSTMVNMQQESIQRAQSTLTKAVYLKRLKRRIQSDPAATIKQLQELRDSLCQPSNFRVLVAGDVMKLDHPVSSWKPLIGGHNVSTSKPLAPIDSRLSRLSPAGKKPGNLSYITPISAIDSSFAKATAKGPSDPRDPAIPALEVAIAYLDAVEGPLWTAIRGTGGAYGVYFNRYQGFIQYTIYRSPDCYKAFINSRKVIEDYISGETALDELALEGAISSIILKTAGLQSTMGAAAIDSVVTQVVRDLPKDWQDTQLEKIRKVTFDEIRQVLKDYILPVFRAEMTNLFVTCAPIMQEGLVKGFSDMGFKPEVRTLADFQDDYGLTAPGDDDGDDEDDEDENDEGDDDDDDEDSEEE